MRAFDLGDVLFFAGIGALAFGLWLIWEPLAYVIPGAIFIVVGILGNRH